MMDKEIIKNIIIEYQQNLLQRKLVARDCTLDARANYVIVGVRRAGKSTLLFQDIISQVTSGRLQRTGFLYINFEDERLYGFALSDFELLLDCYRELYPGHLPWLYLDEVQVVDGWERFARRVADEGYTVRITGSNAKMLSREMAATLGGRYIPRPMWPFSFVEYLRYHDVELTERWRYNKQQLAVIRKHFGDYLHVGGFVEAFSQQDTREWQNALYQKILLGDVMERNSVRNPRAFRTIMRKIAESVMQPLSQARLLNILRSCGESISLQVMKDYVDYMEEAYLLFAIENMASTLVERNTTRKRYLVDNGILHLFPTTGDAALLENLVAQHIMRQYGTIEGAVYYYHHHVEVDFCLPEQHQALQVALKLDTQATIQREVGALEAFLAQHPDYTATILTLDTERTMHTLTGHDIAAVPVWKWLCQ